MNIKTGLRFRVVLLFIFIYILTLLALNHFIYQKMDEIISKTQSINVDKQLSQLHFASQDDEDAAKKILSDYRLLLAEIQTGKVQAKVYFSLILLIITIISMLLFFYFTYKITEPFDELKKSAEKIAKGDFNIELDEKGYAEIVALKKSFNKMSKELISLQNRLLKEEKNRIWKDFSRILAHELKNPLTPIKLSIQRLEAVFYTDLNKFQAIFPEAALIISQEVEHLDMLAKSFSKFSGFTQANSSEIPVCDFLKELLLPYLTKSNIDLKCNAKASILFDKNHLYQILTNILQNAIDATKDGKIIVAFDIKDDYWKISVSDTGKGISKEDVKKIFEPYFSKKEKGIGLGLSIVKKLTELNGAEISANQNQPAGAVFSIKKRIK